MYGRKVITCAATEKVELQEIICGYTIVLANIKHPGVYKNLIYRKNV